MKRNENRLTAGKWHRYPKARYDYLWSDRNSHIPLLLFTDLATAADRACIHNSKKMLRRAKTWHKRLAVYCKLVKQVFGVDLTDTIAEMDAEIARSEGRKKGK